MSLLIKEGALAWVTEMQTMLKTDFETNGQLVPVFVVFAMKNPETNAMLAEPELIFLPPLPDKDLMAIGMRAVCEVTNAVGMLFAVESWSVQGKYDEEKKISKEIDEWVGRLSEHPDAIEVVNIIFEHRAVGSMMYMARIARDDQGIPSLGPFEQMDQTRSEGRFVNILADRQGAIQS